MIIIIINMPLRVQALVVLVTAQGYCDTASRFRREYVAYRYVKETVKQSGNITYHYANLQQPERPDRLNETTTSDCQPNGLETAMTYAADDPNDVSNISLCAWFTNATHNPYRVS